MLKEELDREMGLNPLLEDIDLTVRAYNCLKAAKIARIKDLENYRKRDLYVFRNFGVKSMQEIEREMERYGVSFKR